jgi:hypothetical protein
MESSSPVTRSREGVWIFGSGRNNDSESRRQHSGAGGPDRGRAPSTRPSGCGDDIQPTSTPPVLRTRWSKGPSRATVNALSLGDAPAVMNGGHPGRTGRSSALRCGVVPVTPRASESRLRATCRTSVRREPHGLTGRERRSRQAPPRTDLVMRESAWHRAGLPGRWSSEEGHPRVPGLPGRDGRGSASAVPIPSRGGRPTGTPCSRRPSGRTGWESSGKSSQTDPNPTSVTG